MLDVETASLSRSRLHFKRISNWSGRRGWVEPMSIGTCRYARFYLGEEQKKFAALIGSPTATLAHEQYETNYSLVRREFVPPRSHSKGQRHAGHRDRGIGQWRDRGREYLSQADDYLFRALYARIGRLLPQLSRPDRQLAVTRRTTATGLRLGAHQHAARLGDQSVSGHRTRCGISNIRCPASGPASPGSSAAIPSGPHSLSMPKEITQPAAPPSIS